MDSAGYVTLSRQSGLARELRAIANNIANAETTGFRREGIVFAEHVRRLPDESSLSIAHASARWVDMAQGSMTMTGGTFDLAIQGEGFFLIQTPEGERLSRAGAFTPAPDGTLVTADGFAVLDAGGAPIQLPAGAGQVVVATDGTLSADGQPVAAIGLWRPTDPLALRHQTGTLFSAETWEALPEGQIRQGFLESSNVAPIQEIARMVDVQRAYEAGQKFLEREDERQRNTIQALGR